MKAVSQPSIFRAENVSFRKVYYQPLQTKKIDEVPRASEQIKVESHVVGQLAQHLCQPNHQKQSPSNSGGFDGEYKLLKIQLIGIFVLPPQKKTNIKTNQPHLFTPSRVVVCGVCEGAPRKITTATFPIATKAPALFFEENGTQAIVELGRVATWGFSCCFPAPFLGVIIGL